MKIGEKIHLPFHSFYEVIVLALNFGFNAICFSSQKVKFVWSAFFPIGFILLMEEFLDSKYTNAEFDFDVQIFWIWLTFWNGNRKGQAITSFLWILTEDPCSPSLQYGGERRTSCSKVSQSSDSMMRISPTNNLRQRYRTLCWNTTGYLCVKQMPSTKFFI